MLITKINHLTTWKQDIAYSHVYQARLEHIANTRSNTCPNEVFLQAVFSLSNWGGAG